MSQIQPASPLQGLRIVDFTHVLSGPWATQTLGDFGAEVIKIERKNGDMSRQWGKPTLNNPEVNSYFASCNRNKTSVIVDLKNPNNHMMLDVLLEGADVVVENFRPGTMAKLKLDYEHLREKYPKLIYCSISGYGQTGPLSKFPAVDQLIQAATGMMHMNAANGHPRKIGIPVVDVTTGMYAVSAILAAIIHREKTGLGQYIDIAMHDVAIAMMANHSAMKISAYVSPPANAPTHAELAPYAPYKTKDGNLYIAVSNDQEFTGFAHAVKRVTGCRKLLDDSRFLSNKGRMNNRALLAELIETHMLTAVNDVWITYFEIHGVACAPVNTIDEAFKSDHAVARKIVVSKDGVDMVANPIKFSETPVRYDRIPPKLHESNCEALATLKNLKNESTS